jgi:hypothetical protein
MKLTNRSKEILGKGIKLNTTEILVADCKKIGKTKKQEIADLENLLDDQKAKREIRKNRIFLFKKVDYSEKKKSMILEKIQKLLNKGV